jgi:hypothetical protein
LGIGLLLLIVGGVHALFPRFCWFLSIGWKLRNAEPSDLYLGVSRFLGSLAGIAGLAVLLVSGIQSRAEASDDAAWQPVQSHLAAGNIASVRTSSGQAVEMTPEELDALDRDIRDLSPTRFHADSGSFQTFGSVTITCKDGFQVTLMQLDPDSEIGIAVGNAPTAPAFAGFSGELHDWIDQVLGHSLS